MDDEHSNIPVPSTSFDAYQVALQSSAITATKSSMALPTDLSYHRSLDRKFAKRLDACSARILAITSKLLYFSDGGNEVEGGLGMGSSKGKEKRRLEGEEDAVDGFHSLVVDVVDYLLERADTCLDEFSGRTRPSAMLINPDSQSQTKVTRGPRGGLDPALTHASHLPKPQLRFHLPVDNTNTAVPWTPQLKVKHHAIIPLDQSSGARDFPLSSHPYQHEITHLSPPAHLLNPPSPISPKPLASSPPVIYISHVSQLTPLLDELKQATEIAVDLEHHSYRSFSGFACLMQISTRTQDWIIDCLDPDIRLGLEELNEVFTNPNIVKVFHGADSDIIWLQQNFNLYVVNMFDTYHATKVLNFSRHSLAALLEMFCDFTPDKRYQLADWRIRPLPDEMLLYARSDTHFLLYIYDNLRKALLDPRYLPPEYHSQALLFDVIKRSAETSLRIYVREVYDALEGTGPGGWEVLGRKWNKNAVVNNGVQAAVFKAVHAWRDSVARKEDESTRYVLPNHYVFRLAERPPNDLPSLLAIFQPVPPVVRTRSLELLDIIKDAARRATSEETAAEPGLAIVANLEDDVRIVRGKDGSMTIDQWDQLMPRSTHVMLTSTLFGASPLTSGASHVQYLAPASTLLGVRSHAPDLCSSDRYRDIVARVHSTLVLSPSLPITLGNTTPVSVPISDAKVSNQDINPAAQAEIPYVSPAQRQTRSKADPSTHDNIVVVGQRKRKRKRKGGVSEAVDSSAGSDSIHPKKHKIQDMDVPEGPVEPFDFDSVPNILDDAAPIPVQERKRREKGPKAKVQYGSFGVPPRNMSEVKSGNQSHTFR